MGNVTNNLNYTITATRDSDQQQVMNNVNALSFDSSVAQGLISLALPNGDTSITLPKTTCYQLYVRNTDPANAITVALTTPVSAGGTPPADSKVTISTLYPGDVFILWQNPSTKNVQSGFTTLDIGTQAAGTLCEYFIGG